MTDELRRLAEQAIRLRAMVHLDLKQAEAILDLLDERERMLNRISEVVELAADSDSRVTALEAERDTLAKGLGVAVDDAAAGWSRVAVLEKALLLVTDDLQIHIPHRGDADDVGFDSEHEDIEKARALLDPAPSEPSDEETAAILAVAQARIDSTGDPAALPAEPTYRVIERLDRPGNRADGQRGER